MKCKTHSVFGAIDHRLTLQKKYYENSTQPKKAQKYQLKKSTPRMKNSLGVKLKTQE